MPNPNPYDPPGLVDEPTPHAGAEPLHVGFQWFQAGPVDAGKVYESVEGYFEAMRAIDHIFTQVYKNNAKNLIQKV